MKKVLEYNILMLFLLEKMRILAKILYFCFHVLVQNLYKSNNKRSVRDGNNIMPFACQFRILETLAGFSSLRLWVFCTG